MNQGQFAPPSRLAAQQLIFIFGSGISIIFTTWGSYTEHIQIILYWAGAKTTHKCTLYTPLIDRLFSTAHAQTPSTSVHCTFPWLTDYMYSLLRRRKCPIQVYIVHSLDWQIFLYCAGANVVYKCTFCTVQCTPLWLIDYSLLRRRIDHIYLYTVNLFAWQIILIPAQTQSHICLYSVHPFHWQTIFSNAQAHMPYTSVHCTHLWLTDYFILRRRKHRSLTDRLCCTAQAQTHQLTDRLFCIAQEQAQPIDRHIIL